MTEAQAGRLTSVLASSALLAPVLRRWPDIGLPNGWLAAGAVAQTIWNVAHRYKPEANIRDIDLVYFDADDLSAEAEAGNEARVRRLFS
ncbi:MAG: nucleotidyltransferase family protein, partial [Reyranella sp.]|nr:nucleotidyltransferase family protein [Reyranella sp.]